MAAPQYAGYHPFPRTIYLDNRNATAEAIFSVVSNVQIDRVIAQMPNLNKQYGPYAHSSRNGSACAVYLWARDAFATDSSYMLGVDVGFRQGTDPAEDAAETVTLWVFTISSDLVSNRGWSADPEMAADMLDAVYDALLAEFGPERSFRQM